MNLRRKIVTLVAIPVVMFGFGYLMVPIYNVFCDLTGLNGKTGTISQAQAARMEVDESRTVRVEFTSTINGDTPLDFEPEVTSLVVHPGKPYHTTYRARNVLDRAMVGQAIPSVVPSKAANYFNKTECFCFVQQKFEAGESRDMPLVFVVDPDLPESVDTVTLSYTFFDVTERSDSSVN